MDSVGLGEGLGLAWLWLRHYRAKIQRKDEILKRLNRELEKR